MRKLKMRLLLVIAVLAPCLVYVWAQLRPPPPVRALTEDFVLTGVTLINPGAAREEQRSLTIRQGKILRIDEGAAIAHPQELERLSGTFVLPGLIDMHSHLPPDNLLQLSGYFSLLYLAHGVTAIRDAGDADGTSVRAARDGIASGRFPGPRIFACGPFVGGGQARWTNSIQLGEPAEADAVAARLKAEGYDCIKSYDDLTAGQIHALKEAARKQGLPVIGHVPAKLSYEEALIPDVQHLFGVPEPRSLARDHILSRVGDWQDVDDARLDRIVQVTLEHGLANTPTLVSTQQLLLYSNFEAARGDPVVRLLPRLYPDAVWHPDEGLPVYRKIQPEYLEKLRETFRKKKELVGRLYRAGAELHLGTDVQQPFVVPGASMHQEMKLFAEAGIPPLDVWRMAASTAAKALGQPSLGRLTQGAPADFLIFREDPTRDFAALGTLEAVVVQGRLYLKKDLDAAIAAWQRHFEGGLFDRVSVAAARRAAAKLIHRDY